LRNINVRKIYLRLFDVDWNGAEAVPLATLETTESLPDSFVWVPTVFITNRTLRKLADEKVSTLAFRLNEKISATATRLGFSFDEVQIDCDWTLQTREKYFELLHQLQSHLAERGAALSVTIRLHQVKFYQQTGVPPADRGMLMFYNMSSVDEAATVNSILDLAEAEKYMVNFEQYPLALDVALPTYNWGVLFRDGAMIKLINNLSPEMLADTSRFVPATALNQQIREAIATDLESGSQWYRLRKNTYLDGYYLYAGDLLRLEWVPAAQLRAAAKLLQRELPPASRSVAFYHLDNNCLQQHSYETLEQVLDIFRKEQPTQ
ncbi:MAG: hypothetical protein AAFO94_07485, partial [Bacteroidota bacterium]